MRLFVAFAAELILILKSPRDSVEFFDNSLPSLLQTKEGEDLENFICSLANKLYSLSDPTTTAKDRCYSLKETDFIVLELETHAGRTGL